MAVRAPILNPPRARDSCLSARGRLLLLTRVGEVEVSAKGRGLFPELYQAALPASGISGISKTPTCTNPSSRNGSVRARETGSVVQLVSVAATRWMRKGGVNRASWNRTQSLEYHNIINRCQIHLDTPTSNTTRARDRSIPKRAKHWPLSRTTDQ